MDQVDPAGNETTYQLNATGQPDSVTLHEVVAGGGPAATTTTHQYDALGRETASIDPLGNTTRFTLDAQGRARLVTDPEGNSEKVPAAFPRRCRPLFKVAPSDSQSRQGQAAARRCREGAPRFSRPPRSCLAPSEGVPPAFQRTRRVPRPT